MGIYVSSSAASWLCFVVLLHLMIHTAKGSSTTTTTAAAPASSPTEKEEPKSPTTTSSPTLSTTSSSGSATTEAPALGVDCANKNESWCSTAISGNVSCIGDICQCVSDHFQSDDTTCTPLMDLVPIGASTFDVTATSLNVSWSHKESVKDLPLDHNVTATPAYVGNSIPEVTCDVTSNTTASCSGLSPGYTYNITITAIYNSSVREITVKQESTKPDIPGELNDTSSNFTAPDVTLVWAESSGKVDFYTVVVTQSDGVGSVQNKTTSNNRTMIVIGSLEVGKKYNVTITAYSYNKPSLERRDTFTTASGVPGPPINVTVRSVNTTSIRITWTKTDKPNGVIRAHRVCVKYRFYIDDSYNNLPCENISANTSEYVKSSLTAGTFYQFDVYTVNDVSISSNASVNQRTNESVPARVSGLAAEGFNTSINVTWNRPSQPNGDIITYRVDWADIANQTNCSVYLKSPKSNDMNNSCEDNITEPSNITGREVNLNYSIINLKPHTEYVIQVTAYTSVGAGNTSRIEQKTSVAVPEPVTDVDAMTLSATAVNVTWTIPAVNPGPVNYTVTTNNMVDNTISSQSCSVEEKGSYSRSGCEVTGLEEYWVYNFKVVASTEVGNSTPALSNNVTTDEADPGPVSNFSYVLYNTSTKSSECDATKAKVSWKEPGLHDRNSLIISYVLWSGQPPTKRHFDSKPDPYRPDSKLFEEVIMHLNPQFDYTWEISAQTSGNKTGQSSSLSFTTGVCAPPDWTDSDLKSVKEKSSTTTTLTIVLPSSFFEKTQQGEIQEKGLIILPRESQHFENTNGINHTALSQWQNARDKQFKIDYKIKVTEAVEQEFTIGKDTRCRIDFCNGPLPEQFSFKVAAYACTMQTGTLLCTISHPLGPFATQATPPPPPRGSSQTTTIIILSIILFLSICVACFIFLWYKEVIDPPSWCPKNNSGGDNVSVGSDFTPLEKIEKTRPIKIWEYSSVLEEMHRDTNLILSDQYDDINKIGQRISDTSSTEASRLESNTPKNRWVNILPFDHSRVKLQQIDDDDPTSDYINANYMPGFNNQREYIATQGPLPGTIDDFWRMVWENGVMVIVMLTQCKEGNRVKCEKYWPDELREPKQYGEVVVNPISISTLDKYNISIFDVSVDGQSRQVIHFHYLDFPDFSANVEFDHFITFVRNVRSHVPHDNTGPIIVHCSAGVGRTGTFIATDRLSLYLDSPEFSENDDVDIFGMVVGMRENRIAMVQTESQYIMIHDCFDKMLEEKRKALQATDSTEDLYENQGFDESRPGSHPFPEVLYENVTTSPQQVQLQEQEEEKQQQQTEL